MARSEARISVEIWDDPDFLALTRSAQGTFMFLLSQRDLSHAGVLALRERRWSRAARDFTVADVTRDLDELAGARFVIVDDLTEELLVRSFIRRDKVYRQPNVLLAAADSIAVISSQTIRAALAIELRRVACLEDCGARSAEIVARMLKELGNPSPNPSGNPSSGGSGQDSEGIAEPASNGSMHRQAFRDSPAMWDQGESAPGGGTGDEAAGRRGSENPSRKGTRGAPGERGVVTAVSTDSPSPLPLSPVPGGQPPYVGHPPRARDLEPPPSDETPSIVEQLITEYREESPRGISSRVAEKLAAEIHQLVRDGFNPDHIREGLWQLRPRKLGPGALPSLVDEIANRPATTAGNVVALPSGGRPAAAAIEAPGTPAHFARAMERAKAREGIGQ